MNFKKHNNLCKSNNQIKKNQMEKSLIKQNRQISDDNIPLYNIMEKIKRIEIIKNHAKQVIKQNIIQRKKENRNIKIYGNIQKKEFKIKFGHDEII